jgi:hypothetical protein
MRFASSVAAISFAAATAALGASPPPGSSLDALLAKSRAASGAPYRYHIRSRSREVHDGKSFDVTTETEGLKYRAKSCLKDVCTGFYFDGERSYQANFNDTALPLSSGVDGLELTLRAIASYAFSDPDFRKKGGTLVERDAVLRNGTKYRRISVAPRLGALLDAVIDPASGLVVGVISDERKYAFEFSDQRKVGDKITLPYAISLNGYTFTRYEERSIVATPLEAPAGIAPKLAAGDASVKMRPSGVAPQPVVPCTIGDQAAACLLDTGDSGLSMSLELAEKLKIEPIPGSYDVHGVGQYVTGIVHAPPLRIGSAVFPSADYVVLHDLAQYGYDAILGADFFAHAHVTLDFGTGEVHIAPSGDVAGGAPIAFENFVPVISVGLNELEVPLQIDTGADGTVDLSGDYYAAHPALFKAGPTISVRGIGGSGDAVSGTISSVRLDGFELDRQRIVATKKLPLNGHVGSGLLQHFVVTFDYDHGLLGLVPRSGDSSVKTAAANR